MKNLPPNVALVHYNDIPVLEISHPTMSAKVALQGAHLLSWIPTHASHDIFWLSEVEPFQLGNAIRGGVPICYPWFGSAKQPPHGTARNRLWELTDHQVHRDNITLEFSLFDHHHIEAKILMILGKRCELRFTHLGNEPAQVALHSYFRVQDIEKTTLFGLPDLNRQTQHENRVDLPRKITGLVDEIYPTNPMPTLIKDEGDMREICVEHQLASEIVVWNPWHKSMSGMSENGYKTMLCVETARINRLLQPNEQMGVIISSRQI